MDWWPLKEMIWQIYHGFDIDGGKVDLSHRFPFLEMQMFYDDEVSLPKGMKENFSYEDYNYFEYAINQKSPR